MTSSDAVMDFVGGAVMAAACTVMGVAVGQNGSGFLRGIPGVSHLSVGVVLGAMGGQDGRGACAGGGGELVLSALRPRSYRICAAGGRMGCRYQAL